MSEIQLEKFSVLFFGKLPMIFQYEVLRILGYSISDFSFWDFEKNELILICKYSFNRLCLIDISQNNFKTATESKGKFLEDLQIQTGELFKREIFQTVYSSFSEFSSGTSCLSESEQ